MKKDFSTKWKASKRPNKQRKYSAKAPIHLKRKQLSVNLARDLRKGNKKRNIVTVKGDIVKIMRGKFKGKQGKVLEIDTKTLKIMVEGILVKKLDGSKVNAPMKASNLQIVELNLNDKKRIKVTKEVKKPSQKVNTMEKVNKNHLSVVDLVEKKNAPEKTKNTK